MSTSQDDNEVATPTEQTPPKVCLTRLQKKNIAFLVLAWSCVIACLALILGVGAVVFLSVGGSPSLASLVLAMLFVGLAVVSLLAHWIFARWGRKIGFWVGCALGIVGAALGGMGLVIESPPVIMFATIFIGAGGGIGMYLRFAAVEVVPPEFASRAVTWVLAGGCLAAFAGPEVSQATLGMFGDDENLTFVGTFVAIGGFYLFEAVCVGLVEFPTATKPQSPPPVATDDTSKLEDNVEDSDEEQGETQPQATEEELDSTQKDDSDDLWQVIRSREFLLPLVAGILPWALMAMPMSIYRVPMRDLGYRDRQSLTIIEVQTLSRFIPGFWSGHFIKNHGVVRACQVSVLCFSLGLGINLTAQENDHSLAAWYLGAIFLGFGWNFGFSSATVWSTKAYQNHMHLKAQIQAANEFGCFFVSGAMIFTTGYIYEDWGGGGIPGWRLLNGVLFVLVSLYALNLVAAMKGSRPAKTEATPPAEARGSISEGDSQS